MIPFSIRLPGLVAALYLLAACSQSTPQGLPSSTAGETASPGATLATALPKQALERFDPVVREQLERQRSRLEAVRVSGAQGTELGEAHGKLGMLYHSHGLLPAALVCYAEATTLDSEDFRWAYFEAQAFLGNGQLEEAVAAFERALQLAPEDLPARLALGRALQASGRFEPARKTLEQVVAKQPDSALALFHLSQVAAEEGRLDEAVTLAERALALQPRAGPVARALVGLYGRQGQRPKAEALARSAASGVIVASDPWMSELAALADSGRAWVDRGVAAFTEERWDDAEAAFRQALASLPNDADAHLNLGSALYRQGKSEAAEAAFRRALELAPGNIKAWFNLGTLLSAKGKKVEAVEAFRRTLELDSKDLGAQFNLANALLSLGRFEEAEQAFDEVLRADPARSPARLGRSVALVRLGRDAEAARLLEDGLAVQPNDPQLMHGLVRLLAASPDDTVRDGARALAMAQRLAGSNTRLEHAVALAMAQAERGDFAQATSLQRRALGAVRQAGRADLVPSVEAALALYEAGKPCRTPWTGADFGGNWK